MKFVKFFLVIVVVFIAAAAVIQWYPYIFAKKVTGEVVDVKRIDLNVALMQAQPEQRVSSELYRFAVAIRQQGTGEIYTASSEDTRWAVAQPGQCAEAKFFPYPFWNLEKGGTYYGARQLRLFDCPKK
jgi:hypothetical protein